MLLALSADRAADRRHRHAPRCAAALGRRRRPPAPRQRRPPRDGVAARRLDPGRADRLAAVDHACPERALRVAFGARARSSRASSSSRCRRATTIVDRSRVGLGICSVHASSSGSQSDALGSLRRRRGPRDATVESPGRGPGPVDGVRPRAARGNGGGVRAHRGREARAVPIYRHARRPGLLPELRRAQAASRRSVPAAQARARSPCGSDTDGERVATLVSRTARINAAGRARARLGRASRRGHRSCRTATTSPVVKLARSHRTIELPNPIVLDTKPPSDHGQASGSTRIISPDGDGHNDAFRSTTGSSEPAHGILIVDGHQVAFTGPASR